MLNPLMDIPGHSVNILECIKVITLFPICNGYPDFRAVVAWELGDVEGFHLLFFFNIPIGIRFMKLHHIHV